MGAHTYEPRRVMRLPVDRTRPAGAPAVSPTTGTATGVGEVVRAIELVREPDARPMATPRPAIVPRRRSEALNRGVNIIVAVLAAIVLAPVIALIAILVKLTSRGPVLYSQTRVGLDRRWHDVDALYDRRRDDIGGRVFTIYKFRSMYADAENGCGEVWATEDDPRVTPVGRVLRQLRLDEVPQLYNVVKGDMNIVGPRPERPSIFARLREDITEYPLRQKARPGITGLAQINHTYDRSLDDVRTKVRYDLEYLQRQCLAEDLMIMVKTVPVMLFRRSGW